MKCKNRNQRSGGIRGVTDYDKVFVWLGPDNIVCLAPDCWRPETLIVLPVTDGKVVGERDGVTVDPQGRLYTAAGRSSRFPRWRRASRAAAGNSCGRYAQDMRSARENSAPNQIFTPTRRKRLQIAKAHLLVG